tara:strand:+ start:421 stop:705 length:285 start_codon:yes stop_codon:yes gene_type:complete
MSKQEEVIDLAPAVEKITDEQLKDLQTILNSINQSQLSIGQMETQKASLLEGVFDLQKKLKGMQDILEEEYGKVSVNIQDGTIKPIEDAPDTKD